MTALFQLAGVDYPQWKAVSRTLLRTDFRVPFAQSAESYSLQTIRGLLMMALVNGGIGAASAIVVFVNTDQQLTATVVLSYLAFMLVTAVLTQHGVTLLSATDYMILGPRPVSSRTFLAIRLTNVLFHALLITTFLAFVPVVAFTLAHGISIRRGLAAAVAVYAWATALTLALATAYGTLIRLVGAARLQRALAYLQLVLGIFTYLGFFLATRLLGRGAITSVVMPDEPWPWLIPPAWYASYVEIALGTASSAAWGRAVLSIAVIVGLLVALRGRLGIEYSSRLAEIPAGTGQPATTQSRSTTWFFRTGEARAVAILVLAHFRHDLRVRMGVLGVLPLLVFYLMLGNDKPAADPFAGAPEGATDFIALAVLIFPAILTQQFSSTDAYQASWIYSVTGASRARLLIGLKDVAVVYFLVPFLLLVAALFTWRFGHVGHAVAHAAILGLISHIALQGAFILNPQLPFSRPPDKMSNSASLFGWMMFVMVGGQLLIWALPRFVYVSWTRVSIAVMTLVVVTWILNRLIASRVGAIPK